MKASRQFLWSLTLAVCGAAVTDSSWAAASRAKNYADGTERSLRVLTLNVQEDAGDRLQGVIELIRRSGADVVGLQESDGSAARIAKALGFRQFRQDEDRSILSRFKFGNPAPDKNGVQILLNNGAKIAFFNVHLNYIPYQPYQLLQIPYGNAPFIRTETEALAEAIKARGHDVKAALNDISAMKDENIPLILAGDFNEPSHQDWTEAAAKAGRHPIKVSWPSTKAFADAGLTDAYRKLYPDEMERPGYTWTNTTAPDDPKDHHDRIDFIFYRGKGLLPRSAYIIGESTANADIVIVPYPGDHRSVAVEFTLAGKTAR